MLVQNMKEVESFHDILKYESETFVSPTLGWVWIGNTDLYFAG